MTDCVASSKPIETECNIRHARARSMPVVLHARVITGSGGGPDKTMLNSPRFLEPLGYQAKCMYLRPPNDPGFQAIRDRAVDWNASLIEVDDHGPFDWRIVPKTIEICRREKVQIWHAHDYKTNLLGLLVRKKWPMRMVSTVHGWVELTLRTRLYHFLDRLTLPRYEKIACVSPDLLETCRRKGVDAERSSLIENAIDTEQFRRRQTRNEAKRKLGLPESELLIGAVGRLSPEKGFDRLIGVVKNLHKNGIRPRLAIIGDGGQRDELQSLIEQHDLSASVLLTGFQKNPTDWYEAMDVFALSSLREGLPNVVLEAMALATPVVTTAVAGVPRLIEDDVSGLIVPIADDAALENALARVLGDRELRKRLADAGRQVIETRYSFRVRMDKVADIYRALKPS